MNNDGPTPRPESSPHDWGYPDDDVPTEALDAYEAERQAITDAEKAQEAKRNPPHNLDAERSMLGAMMLSSQARDVGAMLSADDYYRPAHATIHQAILDLAEAGDGVDTITVAAQIGPDVLDAIGGTPALDGLVADTPSTSNAASYAQIVASNARRRAQIRQAHDLIDAAVSGHGTADHVGALEELEGDRLADHAVRIGDTLDDYVTLLEARAEGSAPSGIQSGIEALDVKTGGFRGGQLITICARPGCGKSDMACQTAFNTASQGIPTLFVSIEMGLTELHDRWMAEASTIRHGNLRAGTIADRDWAHIADGVGRLADAPLYAHDDPAANLASIRYEARRIPNIGLVIVDYLQLMDSVGTHENRQNEVAALSRGLKRLARDLDIPVIALAQLNRNLELRNDKRPQLADLRESGAIEQDSDIVIGLYRDELYNPDTKDPGIMEAIVLKQRAGATGPVRLAYDPTRSLISHLEQAA